MRGIPDVSECSKVPLFRPTRIQIPPDTAMKQYHSLSSRISAILPLAVLGLWASAAGVGRCRAEEPLKVETVAAAELKFSAKYPEAPGIFLTASRTNSNLTVTKAELVKVLDAAVAPMENAGGAAVKVEGAHAEKALQGRMDGILMWGPYQDLEPGVYLMVYRFRLDADPIPGSTCFADVCHKASTSSGERLAVEKLVQDQWVETAVPVFVPVKKAFEFRFWPGGNSFTVDRIYVYKVDPGKRAKPEPGTVIPLGLPVQGRPQVALSPHEPNSGQIDIAGYLPGTAIRCPYTGKMFLVP
ncbi:MAG: hypothetical protein JWL81_2656 [Verrucomicrobiales bacterium]|nr:hypothetical protein [Verrucomicrobiales bacterium]